MDEKLTKIRHSLAHVMAAAVQEIYPNVKFGIGPVIDTGFYYDFDFNRSGAEVEPGRIERLSQGDKKDSTPKGKDNIGSGTLTPEIFPEIEKRIKAIIKKSIPVEQLFYSLDESIKESKVRGQVYKAELLEEIKHGNRPAPETDTKQTKDGKVSFYKIGDFADLCKGPHVKNTKDLPVDGFKLTRLAGAYWRGNEKNKMLTRIYAAAFPNKKELDEHLRLLEEIKKRDHKKLGPELDLFTFSDLVGSGLPLWTPKGTLLRNILDNFVWQLRKKQGYEQVDIPHITKKDLYEKSGHWDKFKDELLKITTREGHLFVIKPMNCPHHAQIYARKLFSHKELPQRYANTTKVYRDEQSGELAGLSRVRSITQDDAHVFCRHSQIKDEILKIWEMITEFYAAVGFALEVRLSLHDPKQMQKYLGDEKAWDRTEDQLRKIIKEKKVKAVEALGEAAFYGPKIDFMAKDSLGREWQVATIQLDMNLPERFDLVCVNEKGERERIVIIHAAIMGSIERHLSILIEHFGGAFPVWLSPVQAVVVPISDKFLGYAQKVEAQLGTAGLRMELDTRPESVGKKIRKAELQKVPYILVAGEKEEKSKTVAVRQRSRGDLGSQKLEKFIEKIQKEINEKRSS